jgi:hypothetical protein
MVALLLLLSIGEEERLRFDFTFSKCVLSSLGCILIVLRFCRDEHASSSVDELEPDSE